MSSTKLEQLTFWVDCLHSELAEIDKVYDPKNPTEEYHNCARSFMRVLNRSSRARFPLLIISYSDFF